MDTSLFFHENQMNNNNKYNMLGFIIIDFDVYCYYYY